MVVSGRLGTCLVLAMAGFNAGCTTMQTSQTQVTTVQHGQLASPGVHAAPAERDLTAQQAWDRLMAGNARFTDGRPEHPDQSVMRRLQVAKGQHSFAIVLTCSDSRVPPETLFDVGLGDIFVIRVAGNTADDAAIASVEYAVEHLHVPLIVVLGHERCGAVQTVEKNERPSGHLGAIINPIVPAVNAVIGQGATLWSTRSARMSCEPSGNSRLPGRCSRRRCMRVTW